MFILFLALVLSCGLSTLYCEPRSALDIPRDVSVFLESFANDWCKGGDSWRFYTHNATIDWLGAKVK